VHYSPISDDPAPTITRKETIADFVFDSGSSHSDVSEVLAIKDHGPSPTRIVTTFFVPICISDTDVGSPEASCSTYPTNLRIQVKPIKSNPLSLQNLTPQSTVTSDMHATFLQLHTKWEARLDSRIATPQIALDSILNKKLLKQDIAATHVYRSLNSVLDTQFEDLTRSLESKIEPLITTHLGTAQANLDTQLNNMKTLMSNKLTDMDSHLTNRLDRIESDKAIKYNTLDAMMTARMDAFESAVTAKVIALDTFMTTRLEAIESIVLAKANDIDTAVTLRLDNIVTALAAKIAVLESRLTAADQPNFADLDMSDYTM